MIHVGPVSGIKHLISRRHMECFQSVDVEFSHGTETCGHIRSFLRVRLVDHSLVSGAVCSRFICIDPWDHQELVGNLFLNAGQASQIVHHRCFVVGRAGTNDYDEFFRFPGEDLFDFFISCLFYLPCLSAQRKFLLEFLRRRHFIDSMHTHNLISPLFLNLYVDGS